MYLLHIATIFFGVVYAVDLQGTQNTFDPELQPRIIGGFEVTNIVEFPFQVSLQHRGRHRCGASILSSTWVLTAAHCTHRRSISNLSIRVGSLRFEEGGILLEIRDVEEHPEYDSKTHDYDFSLLRIMSCREDQKLFEPVRLPYPGEDVPDGTWLSVSGWGADKNYEHNEYSTTLRAVYIMKLNQEKCNGSASYNGAITNRMICAGSFSGGMGPCHGDIGGPLTWNGKLIGVASWGYGCARRNYPGVFARVSSVRDWIYCVTAL